ncbi:transcription elongation factor [Marinomonas colpomeniae]|uniref:Transcription elongation factor n=1 Tax=Marinomonas colpomeniae TaxID=2774408 RepID=A0ABR8P1C2_9GAMM|nr:transcription elongation factor [Marinomonas colpomeniae]MBD5772081.1 transcription elongation factor [Marinomonas colpomeniae]
MDKQKIHDAITSALLRRFETAKWAAEQAHDAATSKESIAENKYDTFGLEASYLAHGQSQRVLECEQDWLSFSKSVKSMEQDVVGLWGFVKLISVDLQHLKYFFISPCAGGLTVEYDDMSVFLVTPSSPVGKLLIGRSVEDEVDLLQSGQQVAYEIEAVL